MRIRRWALAASYPGHPYLRWVALGAAALLWSVKSLFLIWQHARTFGPHVYEREGKSIRRQAFEQLRLAWMHSICPHDYYAYAFHRPERYRLSTRFLYDGESVTLLRALNEHRSATSLGDKVRFAEHLEASGIPGASPVAWTQSGVLIFRDGPETTLPPVDLFIKPVASFGGQGAMLWEHLGTGMYGSASAAALLASADMPLPVQAGWAVLHGRDLCAMLVRLSPRVEMMVQRRLVNHPEVADLSTGALLCARVLTGAVQGRAEFVRGVLKMPVGSSIVVNFGIVAPIDDRVGILGSATPFGPGDVRFSHHPDTGARIEGRTVPEWPAIKAIAIEAHHAFPEYTFIGWDIALTPEGVLVLEGNAGWGVESLQKPHGTPLLDTRFTPICLARIAQLRTSRRER